MTTLLARIKVGTLALRKDHAAAPSESLANAISCLTTLYAEAVRVGKDKGNRETTDDEVADVIKKFLKNNADTAAALDRRNPATAEAKARVSQENTVLGAYLPAQASADVIQAAVTELVAALPERNPKQTGVVMAQLNLRFNGQFDKAAASAMVRQALTHP